MIFLMLSLLPLSEKERTAATFNFILEAEDDERGGAPLTFSNSGIDLTASGEYYNGQNWQAANAYLDDHWNGHGDAGLGVCKTITSSLQCNPGSDDNVTIGEKLILDFGQQVTISEIIMADGEHGTAFTGDYRLLIDNIEILGSHSLAALLTLSSFTRQVFEFWNDNDIPDSKEKKRNQAIKAIQGNGNPYIEDPLLIDTIKR